VDKYGGSANKNIGDAFLLVWKFKDENDFLLEGQTISRRNRVVADLALFSFLKIIAKINKFSHILAYRENKALCARMPDYQVKMGFGLHCGWAIEGSIGSFYKIDASYLSPNVNMASRLEAATKQYGVPLLISGALHGVFSKEIKWVCREIDTVTVKGSVQPMKLFTVDMDVTKFNEIRDRMEGKTIKEKKAQRDEEKNEILKRAFQYKKSTWEIFAKDNDFKTLRSNYSKDFQKKFSEGYKKYISGDWLDARAAFDSCLSLQPNDGPTLTLQRFMDETGHPPAEWSGYRELTEK